MSADPRVDGRLVRGLAEARRYDLCRILLIQPGEYLPTVLTVQTVLEHRADAVLAPALAHLGGTERAVALVCDVITPRETVRRGGESPGRHP
ncbi:hypothetical protein [Nocardia mangyaensis]|uniref:hypothetical protein n=1 Tax=Nocardia mangyaensis TaxID=2213200 RepID=UPI0012EBE487|nr:hypothetical protein [Nocardia mangyaensis]